MLMCATAIAEKRKAKLALFTYLPSGYTKQQKTRVDKLIVESIAQLRSTALYSVELYISDDPVKDTIRNSSNYDVLIIGKDTRKQDRSLDALPSFQITRESKCTTIMVKTVGKIDKIVHWE